MSEFAPQQKLLLHSRRVSQFLSGEWDAPPVQVEIAPTNDCNAKCPWCFYVGGEYKQRHSKEEIEWAVLDYALQDFRNTGVKAVTWTGGGDPSVYSHINTAISAAKYYGLKQGIFTNGYIPLSNPEFLSWIRITITEKFIIPKHARDYAEKTKVGVNFNLCADNEQYLPNLVKHARDMGLAYFQVRPALADRADLQRPVERPDWLKEFETPNFRIILTDYKWDDYLKPHGYKICHGHQFVPFLWHNGDVSVCAYHFGKPEYTFGNLKDGGWIGVWEGERRRKMIQEGIKVVHDCQHCCKLHEINKTLAEVCSGVEDGDFV